MNLSLLLKLMRTSPHSEPDLPKDGWDWVSKNANGVTHFDTLTFVSKKMRRALSSSPHSGKNGGGAPCENLSAKGVIAEMKM
jgi:hypothetical protein